MKHRIFTLLGMILMLAGVICMGGCTPTKYDEKEAAKRTEAGKVLLDAYLDTFPDGVIKARRYAMEPGSAGPNIFAGYYLSNVVKCRFQAEEEWYDLYVDLENGQMYTNYRMFDIREQLKRQLKPYCEKYGYTGDYEVMEGSGGASIEFAVISHEVPVKNGKPQDVQVYLENVIPIEFCGGDPDAQADLYFHDQPLTEFDVVYHCEESEAYMDPRILLDYLKASGNYIRPEEILIPQAIHRYTLRGTFTAVPDTETQPVSWHTDLYISDGLDHAEADLYRTDCRTENGMQVLYEGKGGIFQASDEDGIKWTEYEFPLELSENQIIYNGAASGFMPRLHFEQDPGYTEIVRYPIGSENGTEPEKEKMRLAENQSGTWVFAPEDGSESVPEWYYFETTQRITFIQP